MTLILNGTDNSASTPAVTGTTANTGIYYPNTSQVAVSTNGTQALLVDASQNVGIGTASPTVRLTVSGAVSVTGNITGNYILGNGSQLTGVASGASSNISNGTSNVTVVSSGGNITVGVGGTANVAVFATTGVSSSSFVATGGGNAFGLTLAGNANANLLMANIADNDFFRIQVGGTATNAGFVSFDTADDGTEPIYFRQYTGVFGTMVRQATILDAAGNTTLPGSLTINSGNAATAIVNAAGNGISNIGSATAYFSRLFAQATTALYADLAEMYTTDAEYSPGTVMIFGGNQEVTISTQTHDHRVAGVVSTNPAHIMNSGLQGEHTVEVALVGRVPVSVIGNISAGDRVVTSNRAGVAEALDMSRYQPGVIIGKALQSHTGDEVGVIEVVVGRL
jgi:hypothetical protein